MSPRVLHVLEATLGGTRRILEGAAVASDHAGFTSGLVYSTERADVQFTDLLTELRRAGWQLFERPMRRAVSPVRDLRDAAALRRVIREFRPDVVHARSSKAGALARLTALVPGARPPIVYSPHALATRLGRHYVWAERLLAPLADVLAADSESEAEEFRAMRITPPNRIRVVYPVVDATDYAPRDRLAARRSLAWGDGPVVTGVGRLTFQKDPLTFVRAMVELQKRWPDLRAVWVGDGELRGNALALAASAGLGRRFTVAGWQSDVRPYLAASDVVLSTSLYESFGFLVAEPLAMQIPVVSTRIAGPLDVMQRLPGSLLFPPGDASAAADAVHSLLADTTFAASVGDSGRRAVQEMFSVEAHARQLAEAYGAAIDRRSRE